MCHFTEEAAQRFVGMRVGDLFDVSTGATEEAGALGRALHDLAGNILGLPVWKMIGAAGVGNVCIIEGIPGQAPEIDYSAYKITDGKLVVPETPGFGLKLV
jgi:L-alanine-DL-glutamate epimerase-like enolase superfamily enzyme